MKRSGIQRKTALSRRGALLRQSSLTRAAAASRKPLVTKRQPVTAEEKRARDLVRARSNGVCEGCDMARAAHWSHRIAEGQGGPWCPSNGLDLCASCHTGWAHNNPDAAKAIGWIVHPGLDHTTIPVVLAHGRSVYLRADGSVTPTERSAA